MKFIYTLCIVVSVLIFSGCNDEEKEETALPKKEHTTQEQSTYTLEDISSGAKYVLKRVNGGFVVEGHEDKVIMFDMYATYCPPCQKEAPHLTDLQVKYADKFLIIALNTFEDVPDQYIDDEFRFSYGAYYFISNSKHNKIIIETLLKDIAYKPAMQIPFKVVLKDGKYQKLTDIYENNPNNNFYLGAVESKVIERDLKKLLSK